MADKAQEKSAFMGNTDQQNPAKGAPSAFIKDDQNKGGAAKPRSVFLGPEDPVPVLDSVKVPVKKNAGESGEIKQGQLVDVKSQSVITETNPLEAANNSIRKLTDMSAIPADESLYQAIQNLYLWVAACVLAFTITNHASMKFLGGILQTGSVAILAVVLLVPMVSVQMLPVADMDVPSRRILLLVLAVIDGVFSGMALSDRESTINSPLPFVVPLSLGVTTRLLGANFADRPRPVLLAITLAPALAVYMVYGLVAASLVPGYFTWMLSLILNGAFDFQIKLANLREGKYNIFFEELRSVFVFIICHVFYAYLTSTAEKRPPPAAPQEKPPEPEEESWF